MYTLESLKCNLIINVLEGNNSEFISLMQILTTNTDFKDIAAVRYGYLAALYVVKIDYPDQAEAEQYIPKQNLSRGNKT